MIGALLMFGVMAAIGYAIARTVTKHEEARAKYEQRMNDEIRRLDAESESYPREWE